MENTLFYGDNLEVLQKHVGDSTVDLVYIDPPFNAQRDFNVLFKEQSGNESPAQIKAFGDTWNWAGAAEAWGEFATLCPNEKVIDLMGGFIHAIGKNDVTAYLVMMAPRLFHLHRVLKPTGSFYLHCDPTASHYLKLLLDALFGPRNFRNEIIWKRTSAHSSAKRYGPVHDVIFFYTKSGDSFTWNPQYSAYDTSYLDGFYTHIDNDGRRWRRSDLTGAGTRNGETGKVWRGVDVTAKGRHWAYPPNTLERMDAEGKIHWPAKDGGVPMQKRYADEQLGVPLQDIFDDIKPMHNLAAERLGYPTQKPIALLERIIAASSNPGDVVLDAFCGCGTAIIAAQKMGRHWMGIDVTPIATTLIQKRLFDAFGSKNARLKSPKDPALAPTFLVEGLPTDTAGARAMFDADHKKFEMWAVGLVPAIPQEKKGADGGIDGVAYFHDGNKSPSKAVVQIKGGHVTVSQLRDLRGVREREGAALALFVCLEEPTKPMRDEALSLGFYQPPIGGKKVPVLQLRTVGELLAGQGFDLPFSLANVSYQKGETVAVDAGQGGLDLD